MKILRKLWEYRWALRFLPQSLYFNLHYLPFNQAIKLPILLYKPHILKMKGKIILNGRITTGMVRLGKFSVSLYPNNGFVFENHGGTIVFNGKCNIGNNSYISIGLKGKVTFGDNFSATSSFKLTSYHNIEFKENVLCGWNCLFMDTDFHQLTIEGSNVKPKAFDNIVIGKDCWFALNNTIMKGTKTGDYTVIAGNSLLNKDYSAYNHCLLAGTPASVKKEGIYRNRLNDKIDY